MFDKPFNFNKRRNLLEAIGFYLIYMAGGIFILSVITAISFLTALHGDATLHYSSLHFILLTTAVSFSLIITALIVWQKKMDISWGLVALLWFLLIIISAPKASLYVPFYSLFLGMMLPAGLTTWGAARKKR